MRLGNWGRAIEVGEGAGTEVLADCCCVGGGLLAEGTEPAGGEPGAGDDELTPATVEADSDVGRGSEWWVAEGAEGVAIEAHFSGNDGERFGLALWASHGYTSATQNFISNR